jgi:hypothetical protein
MCSRIVFFPRFPLNRRIEGYATNQLWQEAFRVRQEFPRLILPGNSLYSYLERILEVLLRRAVSKGFLFYAVESVFSLAPEGSRVKKTAQTAIYRYHDAVFRAEKEGRPDAQLFVRVRLPSETEGRTGFSREESGKVLTIVY